MGHVGEEFGLVLARTLQFLCTLLQLDLHPVQLAVLAVQRIALFGQRVGTLGQLLVGLLQLGLLRLQMGLGLLEHPGLFLELFVGGLELFLLHLQLFVQLLGFGQHFLQALAIARTLDGRAQVVGQPLEELDVAVLHCAQKAQLDHAIDLAVVDRRNHQHVARAPLAQPGADLEVVLRHLVQAHQATLRHGLGKDALLGADNLLLPLLLAGEAVAGHAAQAAMLVAHVHGRHHAAQVMGEELQDVVAQHRQGQLPQHLLGQTRLPGALPGLLFEALGSALLGLQVGRVVAGQVEQVAAADIGQQCAEQHHEGQIKGNGPLRGVADLIVAGKTQLLLHRDEIVELLADLVGQALALTELDGRAVVVIGAAQGDHVLAEVVPGGLQGLQAAQAVDLLRVVGHQFLERLEFGLYAWLGHFIGVEELLVAGEQEPAHAGFHVDGQLDRLVGVVDHPVGVGDPLDDRQQVGNHGDENHRTDQTDPQGQADVAAQQLAKALLIGRGWLTHWKGPSK